MSALFKNAGKEFVFRAEGFYLEQLVNKCSECGVTLRDIKRVSYTTMEFCVSAAQIIKLKRIAKQAKQRVYIVQRRGAAANFRAIAARRVLLPLIAAAAVLALISSYFVWEVEYRGFERTDRFAVEDMLQNMGLKQGAAKASIDRHAMEAAIKNQFTDAAWVNVFFKGTKCFVDIVEGKEKDGAPPSKGGGVYADRDGYVLLTRVYSGTAVVSAGQTVTRGELLISGDVYKGEEYAYTTAASGEVLARVWHYGSAEGSLFKTVEKKTGKEYNIKCISIGNRIYPIGTWEIPFESYTAEVKNRVCAGENMPLALFVYDMTVYETKPAKEPREASILIELTERATDEALAKTDGEITGIKRSVKQTEDKMTVSVVIEAAEEIGYAV